MLLVYTVSFIKAKTSQSANSAWCNNKWLCANLITIFIQFGCGVTSLAWLHPYALPSWGGFPQDQRCRILGF